MPLQHCDGIRVWGLRRFNYGFLEGSLCKVINLRFLVYLLYKILPKHVLHVFASFLLT